jgi:preprotein translocase subunit SecG
MRRLTQSLLTAVALLALLAPVAMGQASGEGTYGETNDKIVTNAGFILIAAFPAIILVMSLLQWHLDKRKDARKKAAKARGGDARWRGGW